MSFVNFSFARHCDFSFSVSFSFFLHSFSFSLDRFHATFHFMCKCVRLCVMWKNGKSKSKAMLLRCDISICVGWRKMAARIAWQLKTLISLFLRLLWQCLWMSSFGHRNRSRAAIFLFIHIVVNSSYSMSLVRFMFEFIWFLRSLAVNTINWLKYITIMGMELLAIADNKW